MNQDNLPEVLEIRDSDIDAESIMLQIRAAIRERRTTSGLSDAEFDALATGAPVQPTLDGLRRDLERLTNTMRYTEVDMLLSEVRPSPISGLVQRFRAALHEVILFYVNRLAAQQASTNRATLTALRKTFQILEAQQARIEALERAQHTPGQTLPEHESHSPVD